MTGYNRRLAVIVGAIALAVVLVLVLGKAERELRPRPRAAWVGIEVEGERVARVGRVEIASGTRFTLYAVLEAEDWRGRPVYYTEAPAIEIFGRPVDAAALREWDGPQEARILWFTVEGSSPYLEVGSDADLDAFGFREIFHADWGQSWSTPGTVLSGAALALRTRADLPLTEFGTQRYHVRIELYGPTSRLRPESRYRSAGADELPRAADRVPVVISRLPGALGPPSRLFTLSQLEPAPAGPVELRRRIAEWSAREIAFSQATMLKEYLEGLGTEWDRLRWETAEPGVDAWGSPGDLVRVGARIVLSYRDEGIEGRLDEGDLVLDYDRGARLLRLGDVFLGEGLVERSRVGQMPAAAAVEGG